MRVDPSTLTPREFDVVRLVATGMSNQQIADALGITERTVRQHMFNVMQKLDVDNRVKVALWTLRNGVVE